MTTNNTFIEVTFIIAFLALPITTLSQSGSLDISFDTDGIVTTTVGATFNSPNSMAIQNDGKIVVAGFSNSGISFDFTVLRYNTNGSLDTTFDFDGIVKTTVGSGNGGQAYSVALQSDGKILVAGISSNGVNNDFGLVRYNTNGSLDITFGTGGQVVTDFSISKDEAYSIAIQNDGKIVLAGFSGTGFNTDFALARYNTNGILDTTFDFDGKLITSISSGYDKARAVALQSDGKILVVGYKNNGPYYNLALVRYNVNGSLDSSFNTTGIVTISVGLVNTFGYSIAVQNDGKIVVAGTSGNGITLLRYDSNGLLDNSFDTDGIVTTLIGSETSGYSVVIQNDSKIVVTGSSRTNTTLNDFALTRYNSNGSLDSTFDSDGIVTTPIGSAGDDGYSVKIQNDGKIVVAGLSITSGSNFDYSLARYIGAYSLGIHEYIKNANEIEIYPNPFASSTTLLSHSKLNNSSLTIFNMAGQQVIEINNISGYLIPLELCDLPKGLYLLKLMEDNKIMDTIKCIITD